MKARDILGSGKGGEIVAFRNRSGQCQRAHHLATNAPTPAQYRSRSTFGAASLGWDELTGEQPDAWDEAGSKVSSRPRRSQSGPLATGAAP